MELLEYVNYNYKQKNDNAVRLIEESIELIRNEESIPEEVRKKIYTALGYAKGYTEYKTKELSNILGVSKTAIKFMTNKLLEEKIIELVKENNVTFIKVLVYKESI